MTDNVKIVREALEEAEYYGFGNWTIDQQEDNTKALTVLDNLTDKTAVIEKLRGLREAFPPTGAMSLEESTLLVGTHMDAIDAAIKIVEES